MGLFIRNGDKHAIGIDWRAVAALVTVIVVTSGIIIAVVTERSSVLSHVARGEAMLGQWEGHRLNYGEFRHLSAIEYQAFVRMKFTIDKMEYQLDHNTVVLHMMAREMGIDPAEVVPQRGLGPDFVPPGMDD